MTELVVKEVQGGVPCVVSLWGSDGSGILMFSLFVPPPPQPRKPFSIQVSGQLLLRFYKLILALSITGGFCVKNPYKSYSAGSV